MSPTALLADGRVLVVGGSPGGDPWELATTEVWDPTMSSFSSTGSLVFARTGHSATLLPGGSVLVIGGTDTMGTVLPAESWDPATETFGTAGFPTEPHLGHTASLLPDGRLLLVGGQGSEGEAVTSAELFDPAAAATP